jgi:hypothetical protein
MTEVSVPCRWQGNSHFCLLTMQVDDVIWSVINSQFCSYKVKYDVLNLFSVKNSI